MVGAKRGHDPEEHGYLDEEFQCSLMKVIAESRVQLTIDE